MVEGNRILVVDDDRLARESLARWLRGRHWQVITATSCAEAANAAASALPDHAIVEQCLPDGSGLDMLPRLRSLRPTLSAVVVTRYSSIAAAVHAIRLGFKDYLPKPVDWTHLSALFGSDVPVPREAEPMNGSALARREWEHIQSIFFECGRNVSAAARVLGLHRRTLQRKLRRTAPP